MSAFPAQVPGRTVPGAAAIFSKCWDYVFAWYGWKHALNFLLSTFDGLYLVLLYTETLSVIKTFGTVEPVFYRRIWLILV